MDCRSVSLISLIDEKKEDTISFQSVNGTKLMEQLIDNAAEHFRQFTSLTHLAEQEGKELLRAPRAC